MSVSLSLLGLPRLHVAEKVMQLPPYKPVALLLYLAYRADWVSRSELAFLFRPDVPEKSAQAYLRKLIHRARQYDWACDLEVTETHLRWLVCSDVKDFQHAYTESDWARALSHYHGELLSGLQLEDSEAYCAWLELERADLERMWLGATHKRIDELEGAGAIPEALSLSTELRRHDPLDESALQVQLRLLTRDNRQPEALTLYKDFCQLLRTELDAEPLESTRALMDSLQQTASHYSPPEKRSHNLPVPTTPLVGRSDELEQLGELLANPACRLLTLLGIGGVGKTRLALECARMQINNFADGVWFVPLASVTSATLIAPAIANTLGITLSGINDPDSELAAHLKAKKLLLALDNLEQLDYATPCLTQLLSEAPGIKLLTTSRVALGTPNEWLFDVTGLSYPQADSDISRDYDAVRLFVSRAERLSNSFIITDKTLTAIARLCRLVEGMPLALELAASWTRVLSVPELYERLSRNFDLLTTQDSAVSTRHSSMRGVLAYSWQNLDTQEKSVLARLSVFQGGFTLEAAESVAKAQLSVLLRLINYALVRHSPSGRYDIHELVRQYAAEQLKADEAQQATQALCQFYSAFTAENEELLHSSDEKLLLRQLEAEAANLRTAWDSAVTHHWTQCLLQMHSCYFFLLDTKGNYQEGADAFLKAVHQLTSLSHQDPLLAQLYAQAGYFQFRLGHLEKAQRLLEQSLERFQGTSPGGEGFAHHYLGVLAFLGGDNARAKTCYETALDCYEKVDDPHAKSRTQNNLGVLADTLGNYDEAEHWYHLALASSKAAGNLRGVAGALVNLGVVMETTERLDEAVPYYEESLQVYREVGDVRGEAAALTNLGHLAERYKAYAQARDYYEQSIVLKRAIGDPVITAISLTNLGDVLLALGQTEHALYTLAEAFTLTYEADARPYALRVLWSYAKYYAADKRWQDALYLAAFLLQCPESEVWVQQEAQTALSCWGQRIPASQHQLILNEAAQISLESLSQSLPLPT